MPVPRLPFVSVAILLSGCALNTPRSVYDMPLIAVRRPSNAEQRWGAYTIQKADSGYAYNDQLVNLRVVPLHGEFMLRVNNTSQNSLRLIWDDMAFVGPSGLTSKVTSGETRVIDMGRPQVPTTIPAGASALVTIIPNDLVHASSYGNSLDDFVPPCTDPRIVDGKSVELLVPIQVEDVVNEYTLVFQISHAQTRNLTACPPGGYPWVPPKK